MESLPNGFEKLYAPVRRKGGMLGRYLNGINDFSEAESLTPNANVILLTITVKLLFYEKRMFRCSVKYPSNRRPTFAIFLTSIIYYVNLPSFVFSGKLSLSPNMQKMIKNGNVYIAKSRRWPK